jgi:hypothetical protein
MQSRAIHIHFGPSKLALGLILPTVFEMEIPSHVIARPGRNGRPAYGVSLAPNRPLRFYPLASLKGPQSLEEAFPDILAALREGRPMLITSTLRDGVVHRHQFMRELLSARDSEAETIFLACENSPHEIYGKLREEFGPAGVQFPATVVNRICPKFLEPDLGRRVVRGHELGEWLIERPRPGLITDLLEGAALVSLHDDLEALEKRKRWIVNGGQLYLAILAHHARKKSLVNAAATPGLRDLVNHFHSEAIRVLQAAHPELSENLDYCIDHCRAFCQVADDVPRIVAMQRGDLTPFFKTIQRRISEPAVLSTDIADGQVPEVFSRLVAAVDALLERRKAYDWNDSEDPERPATLDQKTDERAVEAYEAMLRGWVEAREIEERAERLAIILRSHHSDREPPNRRLRPA